MDTNTQPSVSGSFDTAEELPVETTGSCTVAPYWDNIAGDVILF